MSWNVILILCVIALIPLLAAYFTHKIKLLALLVVIDIAIPLLLILLNGLIVNLFGLCPPPAPGEIIKPCTSISIGSLISLIVSFLIIVEFVGSLIYLLVYFFHWIRAGKDQAKKVNAMSKILSGLVILLFVVCFFVAINIFMMGSGLATTVSHYIPKLEEQK